MRVEAAPDATAPGIQRRRARVRLDHPAGRRQGARRPGDLGGPRRRERAAAAGARHPGEPRASRRTTRRPHTGRGTRPRPSSPAATPRAERAFRRGMADLRLLVDPGPGADERYVAAGIPWYDTLFGRDSIITSLQLLPVRPQIARDTLSVLARLQATDGRRLARRGARQDPPRAAHRRAGAGRRDPPHALLRLGGLRRRCSWCCSREYERWTARPGAGGPAVARRARGARMDRHVRRPRRRRVRGVPAPFRPGPAQPGLEGFRRRHPLGRRPIGRGSHRAGRGPGLRVPGPAGDGAAGEAARRRPTSRRARSPPRRACEPGSRPPSGSRSRAPTRSRSTATSAPSTR